jgi:hypothetical protein
MTHDQLIAKAVERLRKTEDTFDRLNDKVPADIRRLKVDEMLKRTIRDAVVICFESDDDRGRIEVVMDSQTGDMLENRFIPPKKSDANVA